MVVKVLSPNPWTTRELPVLFYNHHFYVSFNILKVGLVNQYLQMLCWVYYQTQ